MSHSDNEERIVIPWLDELDNGQLSVTISGIG